MTSEFHQAHRRLVAATTARSWRDDVEDPDDPATVQAMQMALNLPKSNPPARNAVLVAAAQAVVAVCLDERAGAESGAFVDGLAQWYGHRIRKVARRARNKAWDDVQALPGVTVDNLARAFVPSAVAEVPAAVAKLQIGHTDLPHDDDLPAPAPEHPALYVDGGLGMSMGKAAAQVGHGSMLLAAAMTADEAHEWARAGYPLSVVEASPEVFTAALEKAETDPGAGVVIRDAGYTEVAPDSATVVALHSPLAE